MKVGEFWGYCERLRSTSSGNAKKQILLEMVEENEPYEMKYAIGIMLGNPFRNFELSMGVGKKTVRKAIEQSFDTSYDEIREIEKEKGNLSEVLDEIDRPNSLVGSEPREPKLGELDSDLQSLARSTRDQRKIQFISDMYSEYTHPKVITFAILSPKKDISLGIGWKKFRDVAAKKFNISKGQFERAHGIHPNTSELIEDLMGGKFPDLAVMLYDRVSPMLASSTDLPENTEDWVGETKYDGGRLLIHREVGDNPHGGQYKRITAYTRQQHEISSNLPELESVNWPNESFIVDTEAVGFDPESGEPLAFQKFMERFQREHDVEEKSEDVEIRFRIFDVLYWRGEDVTKLEYWERRKILEQFFPNQLVAESYDDLELAYDEALKNGHEGIIAKDIHHEYEFDRSRSWRKQKPTLENVELNVVGVRPGTGRRQGTAGALKLETADGVRVGRVGTGMTDPELDELWELHQNDELVGKVVEIKFEELQKRGNSYGLRFPRYEGLRPEGEADTLERLKEL